MPLRGLNRPEGVERQPEDFYATDPAVIPPLLKVLGPDWEAGNKLIWECAVGAGHLSQILELYGHQVISTDLIYRGFGVGGIDFLQPTPYDDLPYDAIITNPPFKYALEFVEKSLRIAPVVCMFLRIGFIESEHRDALFTNNPPRYIAVFRKRARTSKNAAFPKGESSATCHAWFIWYRGFKGNPEILRI
ncbi:MAG: class I SAM-dependent methyltransferase [Alphaproteobacteria bacterium]|nr:class I SAM-dependent methyltransferase [Alphaproteobacteria bacterium]